MKGLLVKDFILMKKNIKYILLVGLVLVYLFYRQDALNNLIIASGFLVGYMSSAGMLVATRTVSTDEDDNTSTYLFTLPFSRKTYVLEKYIFCFLVGAICFIISVVIILILCYFRNQLRIKETLYVASCVFAITTIIFDIMLPVELKFSKAASRIILVLLLLLFIAVIGFVGIFLINYGNKIAFLANMTYTKLLLYLYLIAAVALVISYLISLRIVSHKEF